jgi:hypothetical protein
MPKLTAPREVGFGASLSASISLFVGYEISKSAVVTSRCRICVTYTKTKTFGPLLVASVGVGPALTWGSSSGGGGLQGPGTSHGAGIAGGAGKGGTASIDTNFDSGSGGGGFAHIGPTFGTGAALRFGESFTGCAEVYIYGPFAMIVADNRARKGIGLPAF